MSASLASSSLRELSIFYRVMVQGSLLVYMFAVISTSRAQTHIIADSCNVPANGTGFALNTGVNAGINPPVSTRLTGTVAGNLRYMSTAAKAASAFRIASNKVRVTPAAEPGRFTLSLDGVTPFNFAPALGSGSATPSSPLVYDVTVRIANESTGVQRCSFALGRAEGDANNWDFGIQIYRNSTNANFYTIGKRIDTAASGLGADLNKFITNTAANTYATELTILLRVTDAGAQSSGYNSRVQLSWDQGTSWIYDTESDPDLPNGWRWRGSGRYVMWDVAPGAGNVTYDDFAITPMVVAAKPLFPADMSQDLGSSVTLEAAVSNSVPGNLTVTFYGRELPKPYPGPDFLISVLPDTQNYARESSANGSPLKEMWFAQTDWIVANRIPQNIAYVAHLGDCVQSGDIKNGSPNLTEWRNATNAMYRLENPALTLLPDGIPYGIAVGNHDQEPIGDPDGSSDFYNRYFGFPRFQDRMYYGGHFGSDNDNHYDMFTASGLDFIVLYFEYGRYGSSVLNWANSVLATNQHRRCIVVTHWAGGDTTPSNFSPQGSALYHGLKHNTNFFLMLGGHVATRGGEGSRSDNYQGRTVRTLISDYQGWMNGGNGYMRLMYFSPSNNTVSVKTYSPWLDTYQTDANSQMSFTYNMQLPSGPGSPGTPFVPLTTNYNVAPGGITDCSWSGLAPNKSYEWYVVVSDPQGNTFTSTRSQFATLTKFSPNAGPMAGSILVTFPGDAPIPLQLPASDGDGDPLSFQIKSQPLNGLLADFDENAGTITYIPSWGYRGPDRIMFQVSDGITNSQIGTINLVMTGPQDTNQNGMSDEWEQTYLVSDPNADMDADGQSNLAEYRANTNPTNAGSALTILSVHPESTGEINITWSSVGGTRYRVQVAENDALATGRFIDVLRFIDDETDAAPYGEASTQTFSDVLSATPGSRYYRICVVP